MVVSRCDCRATLRRRDYFVSTSTPAPVPSQNAKIDDSCLTKLKAARVGTQWWWIGSNDPGDYGLTTDPSWGVNYAAYNCVKDTCPMITDSLKPVHSEIAGHDYHDDNRKWQVISHKWDGTCETLKENLLAVVPPSPTPPPK